MEKERKKGFNKIFLALAVMLLVLTFLSKSLYNYRLPVVEVTSPKHGNLSFTVEGTGVFDYAHIDSFYGEMDGRVREILVNEGDEVRKGQCLMRFQTNGAEETYDIVAAESGIIASIGVEQGMYVSSMQNTVLYEIAEKSEEWACYLIISEEQRESVDSDSTPVLYIESRNETLEGEIISIAGYVGQNQTGYKVKIRVSLDDATLYGEKVDITIRNEGMAYDALIPAAALRKDASGYFVLVLQRDNGILGNGYEAHRMSVDLLDSDESYCAVRGLPLDERVIIASTGEIKDGSDVFYEGDEAE